jgi:hypothetical protein
MHTAQGDIAGNLRVGVGHRYGTAFVSRGDEPRALSYDRIRDSEVAASNESEDVARTSTPQSASDRFCD